MKITKARLEQLIRETLEEEPIDEGFFDKAWTSIKDAVGVESPCEAPASRLHGAGVLPKLTATRSHYERMREAADDAKMYINQCKKAKNTKSRKRIAAKAMEAMDEYDETRIKVDKRYAQKAKEAKRKHEWEMLQAKEKLEKSRRERYKSEKSKRGKEDYCMECRPSCPDGMKCVKRYNDKLGHSQSCCERVKDYSHRSAMGLEENLSKKRLNNSQLRRLIEKAINNTK